MKEMGVFLLHSYAFPLLVLTQVFVIELRVIKVEIHRSLVSAAMGCGWHVGLYVCQAGALPQLQPQRFITENVNHPQTGGILQ